MMKCLLFLHFVWFKIWEKNFPEINKEEYECPNLSWLISEIAIEPLFKFSELSKLSKQKPAYEYFYTERINGKTISEIANEIYENSKDINDFQKRMFEYFKYVDMKILIK